MSKSMVSAKLFAGFRRNGKTWPFAGIEIDDSEITDAMRSEPMLAITPIKEKKAKVDINLIPAVEYTGEFAEEHKQRVEETAKELIAEAKEPKGKIGK